ncbi:winged helix-turn-helix transcriptional regulator [Mycobacteroides abscessus]|uniref:winged helix-turn-helix transcriptional regulator n=1 Tax=Mycobacteroides abscessus TaxID=36809 RepID=UPI000C25A31B|nr:helix-turn-helix domain-containing protein [Mycobacteroides abscessus]
MSDATEGDVEWRREQWDLDPDSIALALESLSPRTSSAIIRETFYGTRRFDDFLQHCGVSSGVLAARLRALVEDRILEKVPYQEPGARSRDEYRLTDKGRSLAPILIALNDYADRWLIDRGEATVLLRHHACEAPVHAVVICEAGHWVETVRDVVAVPGPGARWVGGPRAKLDS